MYPIAALVSEDSPKMPFFISNISAGFPSPADDYMDKRLDLNELLIKHPAATYFVRACGNAMKQSGIFNNDILIVDRSITPTPGRIVIAIVDGHFVARQLQKVQNRYYLVSPHEDKHTLVNSEQGVEIWGVVTAVIHSV